LASRPSPCPLRRHLRTRRQEVTPARPPTTWSAQPRHPFPASSWTTSSAQPRPTFPASSWTTWFGRAA